MKRFRQFGDILPLRVLPGQIMKLTGIVLVVVQFHRFDFAGVEIAPLGIAILVGAD